MDIGYWIISLCGGGMVVCTILFIRNAYLNRKRMDAEHRAEMSELAREEAERAAEILSKPKPDTWHGTVDRL